MEGKKLNLNQPFLSVRRHSQGVTASAKDDERRRHPPLIPYYKPELKSGPVGKKGAVPFHWEQTPGEPREEIRTKVENKSQTAVNLRNATKLPPGRYHKPIVQDPQVCQNNFENNGKSGSNYESFEPVKENTEEKRSSSNTEDDGNNIYEDDDDDDEAYTDALDTLSRTDSTFLNCSLSGVSGLEDLDIKPCRNFSRDQNTLDLVMDRFLPAAKAMVSEKPQYASKKPIANLEQSREVNKIAIKKGDDKPLLLRYGPSFTNRYSDYYHASEEDEEEISSDDDCDGHGTLIPSVCGLLPRFCLKGSSGILNPVPGLSTKTRAAKSHVNRVRNRSSSNCPNTMTQNDSERCDTKPVDHTGTVEIKETEATLGSKSCERVFKTFGEFLDDKDCPEPELDSAGGDVAEEVVRIKSIQAIESEPVPNELVVPRDEDDRAMKADQELVVPRDEEDRAMKADQELVVPRDEEDRAMKADQEHVVDCHSEDLKNLHLVESNENATATDDMETDIKNSGICDKKYSEIIISPPLPKSPSDSWLWRTLPSVSAKSTHRHSNVVAQKLNPKVPVGVTRWEAIVKFSKLQHDNSHYPELRKALQKTWLSSDGYYTVDLGSLKRYASGRGFCIGFVFTSHDHVY